MRRRRYPSDTTAAEWALIEPLLPVPACRTRAGGRPEKWPRRTIVDAIRYIVDNGAKWRACPRTSRPFCGIRSVKWLGGSLRVDMCWPFGQKAERLRLWTWGSPVSSRPSWSGSRRFGRRTDHVWRRSPVGG
uniref:transposase n=1 Tax=Streptomyces litchfieldiae TaxID=3075543 RepID=UPI00374E19CE